MYEQPEDISLELIQLATPLALAAMTTDRPVALAANQGLQRVIVACGDIIGRQFEKIRLTVDYHSSPTNTELLAIKLALLRLSVQSAGELLRQNGNSTNAGIEPLLADIETITEQCTGAICEQYEKLQAAYFARPDNEHPLRRPHSRRDY